MKKDKFLFFWGGTFSQWCPSSFMIDGVQYNCCEQYMMAKKALVFGDSDAYREIMLEEQPALQKAIGRKIKGFNIPQWNAICRDIVFDGNYAKFTQNPKMLEELMGTVGREIVEASPEDKIWGIGLKESDPRAWDKSSWQGTNWLGEAIMQVRDMLISQAHQIPFTD